ncbi:MAG: helix-turn-helix transcriptional regulator [Anaerolineae bacterium]|jgi:DNA-binding CsgD family transcriptional regulator|nr:helix-turn-helix transcriptional regulator [Anaerolineae bacterium]
MKTPGVTAWYAVAETNGHPLDRLNRSELKVMEQLSVDATNEEIAQRLYVSEKSVRNHVLRILEKLELGNRRDAARMARQNGLRAA